MGQRASGNIILIGFSTTGKSVVGREVARRLGWDFLDTDEQIVSRAGKGILQIFAEDGEPRFRKWESEVLAEACWRERVVVATGGGAIVDPHNRDLMFRTGVVICLEAKPETIYERLLAAVKNSGDAAVRPLLAGDDPLARIRSLKESRQPYYALADWTVNTDYLTIEEVCDEVVRGWEYGSRRFGLSSASGSNGETQEVACVVRTATASYPVYVGWGCLDRLGELMRDICLKDVSYIVSDEVVFSYYGERVQKSLERAGFLVHSLAVPPGEASKDLGTAAKIYDWLVAHYAERGQAIVALGGGMITDLAGFVAATFLRGLPLVHVPTSLLGMVDAAVGGKVAVDHPQAKNLIGTFYQPRLVLADVRTLKTLMKREFISGWAELIKHALILDEGLLRLLEENVDRLLILEDAISTEAIKRSVVLKAQVVSEDEREEGRRIILNYGHTIGHALEAATDYGRFLHGEAVSIGMIGAALLSHRLGLLPKEVLERQRALLQRFGLPTGCSAVDLSRLLKAMELDKKVSGQAVRWVLLEGIGKTVIRDDVPGEEVVRVIEELMTPDAV